jgi:hypothetical protein
LKSRSSNTDARQKPAIQKVLCKGAIVRFTCAAVLFVLTISATHAGDDASGPTPYRVDLSQRFTAYSMNSEDKSWSASLVTRLAYEGPVIHFVRTSLPLKIGGKTIQGTVYQSVEKPDVFYILDGDVILKLDTRWAYNPGVGGFSMHAPKSRNFIVCLNFDGGVPFLSSSPVHEGVVTWNGHEGWSRLK